MRKVADSNKSANNKVRKNERDRKRSKPNGRKSTNTSNNDDRSNNLNNDVEWYNVYPDLVKSTSNIPTGYPIGINLPVSEHGTEDWVLSNDVHTMRFDYVHGIGYTSNEMDAANMAATRMYSFVRHANSGHANYERTDLMLYFLAVMEVYHWIGNAMRAYGAYNTFNIYNRELPVNTIKALGWDYDALADNAAVLRTHINNAIARVNSLYVPLELNVMKRWWYLVTNCFVDSTGPKAGIYVFTPKVYRTYEEADGAAGYLKSHDVDEALTPYKWKMTVETMLDKLLSSEDIGIISGDILKAYQDRVYTLSYLPEDYTTNYVYSEEMLMQINCMRIVGCAVSNLDITQVSSGVMETMLQYEPTFTDDGDNTFSDRLATKCLLNFQGTNPDPNMVMVASRLSIIADNVDEENHTFNIMCGSEFILNERIYTKGSTSGFKPSTLDADGNIVYMSKHLRFDYAPIVSIFTQDSSNSWVIPTTSHYENIVPVGYDTITNMHQTALLSLFTALV